jgi:hypothetical protein
MPPTLIPIRFIGKEIDVVFDEPPALEKKPGCPSAFVWQDETLRIVELLDEWSDYTRRGRFARNMQPQHASVAAQRGSWGVGRFFFRVRVDSGALYELYYDRAPKDSADRKGSWFLRCELVRR